MRFQGKGISHKATWEWTDLEFLQHDPWKAVADEGNEQMEESWQKNDPEIMEEELGEWKAVKERQDNNGDNDNNGNDGSDDDGNANNKSDSSNSRNDMDYVIIADDREELDDDIYIQDSYGTL